MLARVFRPSCALSDSTCRRHLSVIFIAWSTRRSFARGLSVAWIRPQARIDSLAFRVYTSSMNIGASTSQERYCGRVCGAEEVFVNEGQPIYARRQCDGEPARRIDRDPLAYTIAYEFKLPWAVSLLASLRARYAFAKAPAARHSNKC